MQGQVWLQITNEPYFELITLKSMHYCFLKDGE